MESSPRIRSRLFAPSPAVAAAPLVAHLIVLLATAALVPTASANALTVGGKRDQWAPNVNYTEWAASQRFFLDDWLVFRWKKGYYDVVQVNATDYASCSPAHPITNWSRGDRWAIQLNETGTWYFICSRGYCWSGMKVAVNVEPLPEIPAPAPSPPSNAASSSSPSHAAAIAIAIAIAMLIATLGFGL